jgi:tRNA G18 (ribose-2'-O)-methylase SpoU
MNTVSYTRTCTIGGMLTIILANIHSSDILKTALLAAIGAAVSFTISQVLRWALNRWKRSRT